MMAKTYFLPSTTQNLNTEKWQSGISLPCHPNGVTYENLLNRNFHAEEPNRKWVTDISYIKTKQGVLYLSMIRDLYDNSIVSYKTGTQQTVNLVLDTIRQAVCREKKKAAAELQLHSDQGSQYTSQAYFDLTQEYGITPSMSRRGNCYDNAMAENFFSILKTECIYRHLPATIDEARTLIDNYIYFYNHDVMYRGWITPKNITSWKANFYGLLNQTFAVITLHLICTSRSTRLTPNKI